MSYASQDAEAARHLADALRSAGAEVWFDQSELRGGDAWDRQIVRQIRECALLIAVISTNTDSRPEGYFRREWRIAVERTRDMADDQAFLLPVVIDDTPDQTARVPDKFREVQWTRLPGGAASPAFTERVVRLLSNHKHVPPTARPAIAEADAAPRAAGPTSRNTRLLWIVPVLAVAAAGYFAVDRLVFSKRNAAPMARQEAGSPGDGGNGAISAKSIAVLPFVNMSSDKEQEYFSDGLAEELLDLLAKTPELHVIARTSSFSFKGKSDDIPTIAARLKVANILEGSVRKSGTHLRVTTQLIRADTGEHIWSETYDRELQDVFKVQDEIAGAVVAALKLKLAPAQDASLHGTSNTDAYNEYLLGRQFWNRRNLDGYRLAVDAYSKAVALDPNYAAAYAGLATAEQYAGDATGDTAAFKRAREAAESAVRLGPELADGYVARGLIRVNSHMDAAGALADYSKALALDPGDSTAQRRYAQLLESIGRHSEALEAAKRAIALDPLSEAAWQTIEQFYMSGGDFAAAHEASRHALEIYPESVYALNDLGTLHLLEGKPADALAVFRRIDSPNFRLVGVAMAEHSLGHAKESQQALDESIGAHAADSAYQIAEAYAWRSEKDKAIEWLERAYRQQDGGFFSILTDPLLVGLRGDPRFIALMRKVNLPV